MKAMMTAAEVRHDRGQARPEGLGADLQGDRATIENDASLVGALPRDDHHLQGQASLRHNAVRDTHVRRTPGDEPPVAVTLKARSIEPQCGQGGRWFGGKADRSFSSSPWVHVRAGVEGDAGFLADAIGRCLEHQRASLVAAATRTRRSTVAGQPPSRPVYSLRLNTLKRNGAYQK